MNTKFICTECTLTFNSEIFYKKHLSSKIHFEKIKNIKIDKLNKPTKDNTALKLDPYLDQNDIQKLEGDNIGDCFNIQYKNDTSIKIQFGDTNLGNDTNLENDTNTNTIKPQPEKIIVTQKQIKILQFLIKFQTHSDLTTKMYQILQSIEIKDLNGLITHIISTNSINIKNKQTILKIFKIFKQNLVKLKEKNINEYKNKSIDTLISLINV